MKVDIKLSAEIGEPYVVIHAAALTQEVSQLAAAIEQSSGGRITASESGRIAVLRPEEIYLIRIEGEKAAIYTGKKRYTSGKRLYELEAALGGGFMRISKSALVNLQHLDSVEPSFSGMMLLRLKNGCQEYVSRKYLPAFKRYLGL